MSLSPRKKEEESAPFPGVPLKELPEEDSTPFPGITLKMAPVTEKKQNKTVVLSDAEHLIEVHMQQAATRRSAKELLDASQELADAGSKLVAELRAIAEAYPGLPYAQRFNDYANGQQALDDARLQAFNQPVKEKFVEPYNALLPLEIRDAKELEKRCKDDLARFEAVMRAEQRALDIKDFHRLQQQLSDMLRDSAESERLKGLMHDFIESTLQVKLSQWTTVHDQCQDAVSNWHSDSAMKMQLLDPVWTAALETTLPDPAADTWTAWLDAHEEAAKTDAKLTAKEIKELKEKNRAADPAVSGAVTIKKGGKDAELLSAAAASSPASPHATDLPSPHAEDPDSGRKDDEPARPVAASKDKAHGGGLMSTLRRGKKAQVEPVTAAAAVPEVSLTAPAEGEHDTLAAFMEARDAQPAPEGALFEPVAPPEKKKLFNFGGRKKDAGEKKEKPPKPEKPAKKGKDAAAAAATPAAATTSVASGSSDAVAAHAASTAPAAVVATGSGDAVAHIHSGDGGNTSSGSEPSTGDASRPAAPEKPLPAEPKKKKQLPPGWGCHRDDAGDKYFFNYETGESLWTMDGYSDYSDSD